MAMASRVPKPLWIVRTHAPASIHALAFTRSQSQSQSHAALISGDGAGRVAVTDLRTFRPTALWQAHDDIVLTVAEHAGLVATHGRDNTFKVWRLPRRGQPLIESSLDGERDDASSTLATAATRVELPVAANLIASLPRPECILTFDVNALNYCPFSLLPALPAPAASSLASSSSSPSPSAQIPPFFLAVPHTLEAAWIDVYEMPAKRRIFEAIGRPDVVDRANRPPILMSVHLFRPAAGASSEGGADLHLLAGYEDGSVALRRLDLQAKRVEELWSFKHHQESVMTTAVNDDGSFALSAGADDRIIRYSVVPEKSGQPVIHRTKHQGKASITVRADGKVSVVGGWDGNVRIYDTSDFRALAILDYHKETVQAVALRSHGRGARVASDVVAPDDSDSDSDEEGNSRATPHSGPDLLACGCRDGRISLWQLTF